MNYKLLINVVITVLLSINSIEKTSISYIVGFPLNWLTVYYRSLTLLNFYKSLKIDLGLLFINTLIVYVLVYFAFKILGKAKIWQEKLKSSN